MAQRVDSPAGGGDGMTLLSDRELELARMAYRYGAHREDCHGRHYSRTADQHRLCSCGWNAAVDRLAGLLGDAPPAEVVDG